MRSAYGSRMMPSGRRVSMQRAQRGTRSVSGTPESPGCSISSVCRASPSGACSGDVSIIASCSPACVYPEGVEGSSAQEELHWNRKVDLRRVQVRRWRRQGLRTLDERQRLRVQRFVAGAARERCAEDPPLPVDSEAEIGDPFHPAPLRPARVALVPFELRDEAALPVVVGGGPAAASTSHPSRSTAGRRWRFRAIRRLPSRPPPHRRPRRWPPARRRQRRRQRRPAAFRRARYRAARLAACAALRTGSAAPQRSSDAWQAAWSRRSRVVRRLGQRLAAKDPIYPVQRGLRQSHEGGEFDQLLRRL
jgi:hypothetical protein